MSDKPTEADMEVAITLNKSVRSLHKYACYGEADEIVAQAIAQARREGAEAERETILKLTHSYGQLSSAIRQRGNSND